MKISYQRTYSIGPYLTEKIGLEDEVPDGIDPLQVFQQLKEMSDKAHEELNPHLQNPTPVQSDIVYGKPVAEVPRTREDELASIINEINTCTDLKVLKTYSLLMKVYPEAQSEYDKKLQSLQK